jgi:cell wall-associated NlpC family hydrolase
VFAQNATYVSPFAITLDPSIATWTSDFSQRSMAIRDNSTPGPDDWYSSAPPSADYGPLNPQLFSVPDPINAGNQAAYDQIRYDRGIAVGSVPINSTPGNVDPVVFQRQRVLHAVSQLIGTPYQHLHLPDFNPWANGYQTQFSSGTDPVWPWSPVSNTPTIHTTQGTPLTNIYQTEYGTGTAGIDCTDTSAYIYNLALGIQMNSGTSTQIQFSSGGKPEVGNVPFTTLLASDGSEITPTFIQSPNYGTATVNAAGSLEDDVFPYLQPGDLLYITDDPGGVISHVVIWLGEYGTNADGSPSTVPLVISSHDNTPAIFDVWGSALDANGLPVDGNIAAHLPPPGVHILPFTSNTWFYQNFSVAMQILPVPEPSTATLVGFAAFVLAKLGRRKRPFFAGRA